MTDDFTIELAERRVVRNDGTEVRLSPIEWKLVEALARRADHLVTREELLASVWGPDAVEKTEYLRVHMASIRQKMEPDHAHPRYFVTAPGPRAAVAHATCTRRPSAPKDDVSCR